MVVRGRRPQPQYKRMLVSARTGIDMVSDDLRRSNEILRRGTLRGQSVHHIVQAHRDEFNVCEKTVYNLINGKLFDIRSHEPPEAAYRRQRPRKSKERQHWVERACGEGRSYDDYTKYVGAHPKARALEMDSVIG